MNRIFLLCATLGIILGCSRSDSPKSASGALPPPAPSSAPAAGPAAASPGKMESKLTQAMSGDSIDLNAGVKEALQVATTRAVDELTGPNGFQKNLIPLPATVEKARPFLKAAGKEDLLNSFSTAINSAAADAVKQSPAVLNTTVQSMQLGDVTELWHGGKDAFTRYLEKHARAAIAEKMMPSIKAATEASGATRTFKQINSSFGEKAGGLFAGIQSATGVQLPGGNFDLDNYVADHTLDNLFNYMAVEEQKMRENPAARSSQLLKSLFSRFGKN